MTIEVFHRVLEMVAKCAGVTIRIVLGTSRTRYAVAARHVIAWLMHRVFGMSHRESATALRMLDHTTTVHACAAVESELRKGKGRRADLLLDVIGRLAEAA